MFKAIWEIFLCNLWGVSVGQPVFTEQQEYAGLLWTNRERQKKYIIVCWDFNDEYCPLDRWERKEKDNA